MSPNNSDHYDIRAKITITDKDECFSGYRPAHLINNILTTGIHTYIGTDSIKKGQSAEGYVTFITPEYYPHSISIGDRIPFQDGSKTVGYIEVLEIFNDLLNSDKSPA